MLYVVHVEMLIVLRIDALVDELVVEQLDDDSDV